MTRTNYVQKIIETAEDRFALVKSLKESQLPVQIYSEEDFDNERFKKPFNCYIHVCYSRPLIFDNDAYNSANFGASTVVKVIDGRNYHCLYRYQLMNESYYEVGDAVRLDANFAVKSQSARALRSIVTKVEKQFNVKISVDKEQSHKWMPQIITPSPLKNNDYDGMRVPHVYGYDLNSAYSYYIVKYGLNWCTVPGIDYAGQEATINAATNAALVKYIDKWYEIKSTTTDAEVKKKAKFMLNMLTGHIRNINPQAYNDLKWGAQSVIDDYMKRCGQPVIYSNIDSIYTIGKSAVLEALLGTDIGQFKLEHEDCDFTWQLGRLNYQINDEYPVARGVPKTRFKQFAETYGRPFILNRDVLEPTKYYTSWDLTK